jgi:hypothetical protein
MRKLIVAFRNFANTPVTRQVPRRKDVWWSGGTFPLSLGTRTSVVFTLRPLYLHGKRLQFFLDRRMGGTHSGSKHYVKVSCLFWKSNTRLLCRPLCSLVTILTRLSRLLTKVWNHVQSTPSSRLCSYYVALRRFRVAFLAVEKQYHIFWVSVASVIQHTKRMRRTVICGLSASTLFFHISS